MILKFLLINDDVSEMETLRQIILDIDPTNEIDMSHSSSDALNQFRKRRYDIVITEIYLGGIQGNVLIDNCRNKCFKVGMAEHLDSPAIRQPFNHFLIKPISKESIEEVIKMCKYNIAYNLI